ncbi:hypothetical protein [uncultured Clostridium sp.]|jgi:hypothetical protein|uniref:hypothetical protein n=1 Tax=uncultured Clostridium sp. TaxID=59620 RepID=UPI002612D302|nr:hypothetical protein [uncultured Clostridium sp.]
MKVKNAVLFFSEKDIKELLNFGIKSEGISINEIKFKKSDVEIRGSIKKMFTLDFICSISIVDVKKEKISIKINDVKALKINLFSVIEKIITSKNNKISLGRFVSIDKNIISINLDVIKCKFKDIDFELNNIELIRDGLDVKFDYIDVDCIKLLNSKMGKKKEEKMVN